MIATRTAYQSTTDKALSWLFVLPVIIILLLAAFIPLGWGLYLSFFRYKLNIPSATAFIGLKNYLNIFTDELTILSLRNNIIFAAVSVCAELLVGVVIAMMLSGDTRLSRGLVSILMVPMIIAPVAAGTLWRMMLDRTYGVINYLLSFVGVPPILWLGDPKIALYTVAFVDAWLYIPFVAVLVLSSIKAMPTSFLDAARVDGASPWKVFWWIILPIISPVIIIVAMLRFIDAFKVFDTIFVMTQGGPGNATEMLPTYIYRQGIKFLNIGYSSATAIVFVIAMSVVAYAFQKLRDRQLARLG
ncbi:MAG: sugar ABC transporter permease, partial [Spirochaetes bacterium]|jgi:multiple sugar transport system permease protein|nr:sugar ABC transporter permease [Spirochaetota bacterium]